VKVRLIFEDWRRIGQAESIYNTGLGVELSMGDLHAGSTWEAEILCPAITLELLEAFNAHQAYAVFRIIPKVASTPQEETP